MLVKSQVKYIQSLSQKKLRDEEAVFIAEGPKIINELLAASTTALQQLYATESWLQTAPVSLQGVEAGKIISISDSELERISFLNTPNQALGLFAKPVFNLPPLYKGRLSLVLDTIQDPGNMGTIIRCADWFGIAEIICSDDCADVFSPKVVQSSMGSIARVKVSYTSLKTFMQEHAQIPVYAALLDGTNVQDIPKPNEGFLLIGNESKGIRPALLNEQTHKITIPRIGRAESLNAAVATGIILSRLT